MAFDWAHLFASGGLIFLFLILCAVIVSITLIERIIYYNTKDVDSETILAGYKDSFETKKIDFLISELLTEKTPLSYVLSECLKSYNNIKNDIEIIEEIKTRAIAEKLSEMERYLTLIATLGSISPYIGLFGTVLGIIRSFQSMGAGSVGLSGVNAGIADALVATAAGLFVAIPATAGYNYLKKRQENMILRIEIEISRLKLYIKKNMITHLD